MIKLSAMFLLVLLSETAKAQKQDSLTSTVYSFQSLSETDKNSALKLAESFILNSIEYIVRSNQTLYQLSASYVNTNSEHIRANQVGPGAIYMDMVSGKCLLDDDTLKFAKFESVHFIDIETDTIINGYNCKIFINKNSDTLFLSKTLPFFINPFLLTNYDIPFGVVKALIKKTGVFTLSSMNRTKGTPFRKSILDADRIIEKRKNVFFPY